MNTALPDVPSLPALEPDWLRRVRAEPEFLFDIQHAVGGPFHLVYPDRFAANLNAFRDVLAARGVAGRVYYGKKANKAGCWLDTVAELDGAVDVASEPELVHALAHGIRGRDIGVTGAAKSTGLLRLAARHDCVVAIDALDELERLAAIAASAGRVRVLLRRLPPNTQDSRFGLSEADLEHAIERCARLASVVELIGFSFHLDGYAVAPRAELANALIGSCATAKARGLPISAISIGGGFACSYLAEADWARFLAERNPGWFHAGKTVAGSATARRSRPRESWRDAREFWSAAPRARRCSPRWAASCTCPRAPPWWYWCATRGRSTWTPCTTRSGWWRAGSTTRPPSGASADSSRPTTNRCGWRNSTARAREAEAIMSFRLASRLADYRAIVALAAPIAGIQLAQVALTTVDLAMMGLLGVAAVAAGGLALLLYNQLRTMCVGMVTGVGNMIAAAVGRGEKRTGTADLDETARAEIRGYVRAALAVATGTAAAGAVSLIGLGYALAWLGQDPVVLDLARPIIWTLAPGLIPMLWLNVLRQFAVGMRRAGSLLRVTLVSIAVNALLNALFLFGWFGLPKLGLAGIGLATTLVQIWTCGTYFATVRRDPALGQLLSLRAWRADRETMRRIVRMGTPIALTYGAEAAVTSIATLLMGVFGPVALAASNIVNQLAYIVYQVNIGLSQGSSILISRTVGRGEWALVAGIARRTFALGFGFMTVVGLGYVLFPGAVLAPFLGGDRDDAAVVAAASTLLWFAIVQQYCKGSQNLCIGLLRGIGETKRGCATPWSATSRSVCPRWRCAGSRWPGAGPASGSGCASASAPPRRWSGAVFCGGSAGSASERRRRCPRRVEPHSVRRTKSVGGGGIRR
ncbi:putative efflux protein, MATE family [Nocardia amikacinitolerans]|nr:putative efflux protein, MATE family [Nocardia amikacinitolerans]